MPVKNVSVLTSVFIFVPFAMRAKQPRSTAGAARSGRRCGISTCSTWRRSARGRRSCGDDTARTGRDAQPIPAALRDGIKYRRSVLLGGKVNIRGKLVELHVGFKRLVTACPLIGTAIEHPQCFRAAIGTTITSSERPCSTPVTRVKWIARSTKIAVYQLR